MRKSVRVRYLIRLAAVTSAMLAVALLWSCSTSPPRDISNSCEIFDDKSGWYKA